MDPLLAANTYELKQISLARRNTDKIDADKLCRIIKTQALTGEQLTSPVTIPLQEIQDLRKLSSTLLTQSPSHSLHASLKLRKWHGRLSEYKKAGLARTGLAAAGVGGAVSNAKEGRVSL